MPFHLKAVHAPAYKHARFHTVSHTVIDIVILDLFHTKVQSLQSLHVILVLFRGEKPPKLNVDTRRYNSVETQTNKGPVCALQTSISVRTLTCRSTCIIYKPASWPSFTHISPSLFKMEVIL